MRIGRIVQRREILDSQSHTLRTLVYKSSEGSKYLKFVPKEMTNATSLDDLRKKVKQLTFDKFPCKFCKTYIQILRLRLFH